MLPPTDRPVDAVIDTDVTNEIDDQFAVVWALLRRDRFRSLTFTACPYAWGPELVDRPGIVPEVHRRELRRQFEGVPVADLPVRGPAEGVRAAETELGRILALLDEPADGRVHRGAERFMSGPDDVVDSPAARHIVERARAATPQDPLWVLAIGCATNVAAALALDPSITDRVVVVWTSAHPTSWPDPDASYNLGLDVHAARRLLASGARVVYVPGYYVGEQLRLSEPDVLAHLVDRGAVGHYLARTYLDHPMVVRGPGRSRVIWDLVCPAWVIDPTWFTTRTVPAPTLTDDLRWRHVGPHELVEATAVERDLVVADLYAAVAAAG